MNPAPPTKKWNPLCDDREKVRAAAGVDAETLDRVLDALFGVVCGNVRTSLVGLATFAWKPYRCTIPTGARVATRRLTVEVSRYLPAPARDIPATGRVNELKMEGSNERETDMGQR